MHLDGRVLGAHDGVIHYTIGQRRGLGVATGDPLYVVKIDAPARQVIVGSREALLTAGLTMEELNWLGDDTLEAACFFAAALFCRCSAQIRISHSVPKIPNPRRLPGLVRSRYKPPSLDPWQT